MIVGFRWLLAIFMVTAGIAHFAATDRFAMIVPDYLPWPKQLVLVSGAAEIVLGLALLWQASRRLAGIGLILLYVAVFPANVHMAVHGIQPIDYELAQWQLWVRLPLQLLMIFWAWVVSKADAPGAKL